MSGGQASANRSTSVPLCLSFHLSLSATVSWLFCLSLLLLPSLITPSCCVSICVVKDCFSLFLSACQCFYHSDKLFFFHSVSSNCLSLFLAFCETVYPSISLSVIVLLSNCLLLSPPLSVYFSVTLSSCLTQFFHSSTCSPFKPVNCLIHSRLHILFISVSQISCLPPLFSFLNYINLTLSLL